MAEGEGRAAQPDELGRLRCLPLIPGTNRPILTGWPSLASADPDQWAAWRQEFPRCNWGVKVGDGLGVLDLDTKNDAEGFGGFKTLIDIEELLEIDLSNLPLVTTFSGAHLYFRYEGTLPSKVPWVPHVDVKADGGHQVAAPDTIREVDGVERVYTLLRGSLEDVPFAPDQLLQAIRQWRIAGGGGSGGGSSFEVAKTDWLLEHGFRVGERDNGFNTLVWRLTRTHYPHMELVRRLAYEVWLRSDNPDSDPFPWRKVEVQIARAEKAIGPDVEAQTAWAASIRSMK